MNEQVLYNYLRNYFPSDLSSGLRANNPPNPALDFFGNAFYNSLKIAVTNGGVDEFSQYGHIFCLAGLLERKDGKRGYVPTQKARDLIERVEKDN